MSNREERAYGIVRVNVPGFCVKESYSNIAEFSDLDLSTRIVFEGEDWTALRSGLKVFIVELEGLLRDIEQKEKEPHAIR
jgi:hypothetical protein